MAPVTTFPASGPVLTGALPPVSPIFILSSIAMGVSGCSLFGVTIAGLVLLILMQRALSNAARLAEAAAAPAQTQLE